MSARSFFAAMLLLLTAGGAVFAEPAPFNLAGPTIRVSVTRGSATLPISKVPNLAAGDHLAIDVDLPDTQSQHYLLVAAFLREVTNPPPKAWFYRAATSKRKRSGGLRVTVPAGARQVVVFLAPETGGDFGTIVSAVRGRPGAFIRAAQELNQAALDHSRLDTFLTAVRGHAAANPAQLETLSPMLARSLAIKIEASCLDKIPDLQAACLTQDRNALVMNDGHSNSIADALTGAPADLVLQLSATPQAGLGYYSPYIAVVREVVRILGSFGTAQYQYIPALATRHGDGMSLLLNAPPSFNNPRSVLVTALPAVEPAIPPPLRSASKSALCAGQPGLVLPVEGAPLVYSTAYAHDLALRLQMKDGKSVELPAKADPEKGGVVVDMKGFAAGGYANAIEGMLHGTWGFDPFEGPRINLQNAVGATWHLAAGDEQSLVAGRDATIRLEGAAASCLDSLKLRYASDETESVKWTVDDAGVVTATLPLAKAEPGALTLLIGQHGRPEPIALTLNAFAEETHIDGLSYHVGDTTAQLSGRRLDQVRDVRIGDIDFKPQDLTRVGGADKLAVAMADPLQAAALSAGRVRTAKVRIADGRTTTFKVTVAPPRPTVTLVDRTIAPAAVVTGLKIGFKDPDALPVDSRLTFSIRAIGNTRLAGQEVIEVAAGPGIPSVQLTPAEGLTVRDATIAVATFQPAKAFTRSAFGPLRFRIVQDGVPGDWQSLAMLVRLPVLHEVTCDRSRGSCMLAGSGLFLIEAVSNSASFSDAMTVPDGLTSDTLRVPRPRDGHLYLKLHDAPGSVAEIVVKSGQTATGMGG